MTDTAKTTNNPLHETIDSFAQQTKAPILHSAAYEAISSILTGGRAYRHAGVALVLGTLRYDAADLVPMPISIYQVVSPFLVAGVSLSDMGLSGSADVSSAEDISAFYSAISDRKDRILDTLTAQFSTSEAGRVEQIKKVFESASSKTLEPMISAALKAAPNWSSGSDASGEFNPSTLRELVVAIRAAFGALSSTEINAFQTLVAQLAGTKTLSRTILHYAKNTKDDMQTIPVPRSSAFAAFSVEILKRDFSQLGVTLSTGPTSREFKIASDSFFLNDSFGSFDKSFESMHNSVVALSSAFSSYSSLTGSANSPSALQDFSSLIESVRSNPAYRPMLMFSEGNDAPSSNYVYELWTHLSSYYLFDAMVSNRTSPIASALVSEARELWRATNVNLRDTEAQANAIAIPYESFILAFKTVLSVYLNTLHMILLDAGVSDNAFNADVSELQSMMALPGVETDLTLPVRRSVFAESVVKSVKSYVRSMLSELRSQATMGTSTSGIYFSSLSFVAALTGRTAPTYIPPVESVMIPDGVKYRTSSKVRPVVDLGSRSEIVFACAAESERSTEKLVNSLNNVAIFSAQTVTFEASWFTNFPDLRADVQLSQSLPFIDPSYLALYFVNQYDVFSADDYLTDLANLGAVRVIRAYSEDDLLSWLGFVDVNNKVAKEVISGRSFKFPGVFVTLMPSYPTFYNVADNALLNFATVPAALRIIYNDAYVPLDKLFTISKRLQMSNATKVNMGSPVFSSLFSGNLRPMNVPPVPESKLPKDPDPNPDPGNPDPNPPQPE